MANTACMCIMRCDILAAVVGGRGNVVPLQTEAPTFLIPTGAIKSRCSCSAENYAADSAKSVKARLWGPAGAAAVQPLCEQHDARLQRPLRRAADAVQQRETLVPGRQPGTADGAAADCRPGCKGATSASHGCNGQTRRRKVLSGALLLKTAVAAHRACLAGLERRQVACGRTGKR